MAIDSEPKGALKSRPSHVSVPPDARRNNTLTVMDNRTGNKYVLPIKQNSISAMDFKQFQAPQDVDAPSNQAEYGIRVYDPGFGNTAVTESSITYKSVSLCSPFYCL